MDNQISIYAEQINGYSKIIMNHLITNEIDAIDFLIMYILMFVLYSYQCIKINNYARSNNQYIGFQVLFCILTLMRIMEISYAYLGFEIDQWSNVWKIDGEKLIYCDPALKYDTNGCCYSRYEITGIFQNLYLYLGIVVIQMISFFWAKQITPLMFISVYQVLMNQYVPLSTKLVYIFFIIIDIIMLACQIIVWTLGIMDALFILRIFQIVFAGLTTLNFIYNIYKQHMNGENIFKNNQLKVCCIAAFVAVRTGYIILRLLKFDEDEVKKTFKKTVAQSTIYLCFNILEYGSRILMIKLF